MVAVTTASVVYSNDEDCRNIKLLSAYANLQQHVNLSSGKVLALESSDGTVQLTGLNTICRYLAGLSSIASQLLGKDQILKAQTSEWLSYRAMGLSPITETKLIKISEHLLTRIFLVSDEPTLADLCLFTALHQALVSLPPAQVHRYCNLVRWYDHMQHAVDKESIYPKVKFSKPSLPGPPPTLPATAKQPAGKAEPKPPAEAKSVSKKTATEQQSMPASKQDVSQTAAPTAQKVESSGQSAATQHDQAGSEEASSSAKDAKQAKKDARKEARKEAEPKKADEASIDMLDIRVGQIIDVSHHPSAETLYVEQIDLGEEKPRQVVSGLRKHVSLENMQNRKVIVCTNLKPAKMRDVMSYGMILFQLVRGTCPKRVLCASDAEKVIPLTPPPGAAPGDRVSIPGYSNEPLAEVNPKKKILEKSKPDMHTDASGNAMFKDAYFRCGDVVIASDVPNGAVG